MKKIFIYDVSLAILGMLLLGGCSTRYDVDLAQEILSGQVLLEQEFFRQDLSGQEFLEPESIGQESSRKDFPGQTTMEQETPVQLDFKPTTDELSGSSVPTIRIIPDRKGWRTEDGEVVLLEVDASRVEVVNEGFDALRASLAAQWDGISSNYDEDVTWLRESYDDLKDDYHFPCFGYTISLQVFRLDDQVVSFCENNALYLGGSHGTYELTGRTYDVKSGVELQLEDILRDPEGFYDEAVECIIEELKKKYGGKGLHSDYEQIVRTDTFGATPVSWYLDNSGIVIMYPLYMIATYACGVPSVTLPYDVFSAYIKEDYAKPGNSLVARVSENEDLSGLIGETGEIMLTTACSDDFSSVEVAVVSENAHETVGTFRRVLDIHVIKREDGHSFLIFSCDYASDDFVTYVYEITGGRVRMCDKTDNAECNVWGITGVECTGIDRIGLATYLDVLGTYAGERSYQLTSDGKLVPTEEIFVIDTLPSQSLKVIKELPVIIDGEKTTISAGSWIRITGTDNAGKAYFQVYADGDEQTGMIQYVRDEEQGHILIDGVSEYEYFEMIPYAE